MDNSSITADALDAYRQAYYRIHGKWPKLNDAVEHFDGKLLNVLMCVWELKDRKAKGEER